MAMATECQTPNAVFHTQVTDREVVVRVEFGRAINLNEDDAALLEANIHNALELVLARYFLTAGTKKPTGGKMSSFAQRIAEQIDAEAHSGSGSWDELNGTLAVLREVSDTRYTITIPQEYDENDEPTDHVCVITVECGQP